MLCLQKLLDVSAAEDSTEETDDEDVICRTCKKWFTSEFTLMKHRMWHHKSELGVFKYNCDKCPYATNASSSLKTHEGVHALNRPYKCRFCGNGFKALSSLNNHIVIHVGEKLLVHHVMPRH
ncbi:zinc finger protein 98-like [Stegodyphus dumicola]|uniref:zinc finger protein 98-like n=1 Tax=Stegodyphus dumicola TaxID=202533 RepID=UPI0015AE4E50|nr:zinc finger protein 98-like [Stegodyphus dumicola]